METAGESLSIQAQSNFLVYLDIPLELKTEMKIAWNIEKIAKSSAHLLDNKLTRKFLEEGKPLLP